MHLTLFGHWHVGKGTLANRLSLICGLPIFNLRIEVQKLKREELDPEAVRTQLDRTVEAFLARYPDGAIWCGYPANMYQAKFMAKLMHKRGVGLAHVFYLAADLHTLERKVQHNKRGKSRKKQALHDLYAHKPAANQAIHQLTSFFGGVELLRRVDAAQSPEHVLNQVLGFLGLDPVCGETRR